MRVRLNLMPWREHRRARAVRQFQIRLVVTLVVALGAVTWLDQMARSRLARQALIVVSHQAELERLDISLRHVDQLRGRREALQAEHAALSALGTGRSQMPDLFLALEQALPEGARLTEVDVEAGRLRLGGLAASATVVAQFMRDLEHVGVVRDLELVQLRRHDEGDAFLLAARLLAGES